MSVPHEPIDPGDLRQLIYAALQEVELIIEAAGDGVLPSAAEPYVKMVGGASLLIGSRQSHGGRKKLRWSHIRDTINGLRIYMILREKHDGVAILIDVNGLGWIGLGAVSPAAVNVDSS